MTDILKRPKQKTKKQEEEEEELLQTTSQAQQPHGYRAKVSPIQRPIFPKRPNKRDALRPNDAPRTRRSVSWPMPLRIQTEESCCKRRPQGIYVQPARSAHDRYPQRQSEESCCKPCPQGSVDAAGHEEEVQSHHQPQRLQTTQKKNKKTSGTKKKTSGTKVKGTTEKTNRKQNKKRIVRTMNGRTKNR